jgi:hypothetical protein
MNIYYSFNYEGDELTWVVIKIRLHGEKYMEML